MTNTETTVVSLPVSLYNAFQTATAGQCVSPKEAFRRIIRGLAGLSTADLRSLQEPRNHRNRNLEIDLEREYVAALSEAGAVAQLTIASVFRRILNALLVTQKVRFVATADETEFLLELTQRHFEFAEDHERDRPSPLLGRQHQRQW